MNFKITNALRIISILLLVVVFFISYAGLPEQLLVLLDEKGNPTQYFGKNLFFYSSLTLLVITNALLYVLAMMFNKSDLVSNQHLAKFIAALAIVINIFFCVALTFIGILNGQENFDYSSFAPFIYASLSLFGVWVLAFVFSVLKRKKSV